MLEVMPVAVPQPIVTVLAGQGENTVVQPVYKSFNKGNKRQGQVDKAVKLFLHDADRTERREQIAWDARMISLGDLSEEVSESLGHVMTDIYDRHQDPDEDPNLCRQFWAEQGVKQQGMYRDLNMGFRHQVE